MHVRFDVIIEVESQISEKKLVFFLEKFLCCIDAL